MAREVRIASRPRDGAPWLYFGQNTERFLALERAHGSGARPSAGALVDAALRDVRRELIDVDAVLEYRDELRWHASAFAERSPYLSAFLYNAAALIAVDRLLRDRGGDLTLVVDDRHLAHELASIADRHGARVVNEVGRPVPRVVRLAAAAACRPWYVRDTVGRRRRIRARRTSMLGPVDVMFATWVEDDAFDTGGDDRYFGSWPRVLSERGVRVGFLALPLPGADDGTLDAAAGTVSLTPEECTTSKDILRFALTTLAPPARIRQSFVVDGVDLTATVREMLSREARGPRGLWSRQFAAVGSALRDRGIAPRAIVVPFENQAWEKALRLGVQRALPGTAVVGYQHTPTSHPGWFPCSPSARDIADNVLPDVLYVTGELWVDEFAAAGFPRDRVRLAPPFRYRPAEHNSNRAPTAVLVACAGAFDEALELAAKAARALGGREDLRVLVKTHPDLAAQEERFARELVGALGGALPTNTTVTATPIAELLSDSDVLLHTYTAVAYEALAHRVPSVFVASDFLIDIDPLPSNHPSVRARTAAEIANAVDLAIAGRRAEGGLLEATLAFDAPVPEL